MSYVGLWRVSVPQAHKAYATAATRAAVTSKALLQLAERPMVAKTLRKATTAPPPLMAQPFREDVRILDPLARALSVIESLTLAMILRSLCD